MTSKARPRNRAGWVLAACAVIPSAVLTGESIAHNSMRPVVVSALDVRRTDLSVAVFAGGCFWSMERPFDHVPGIVSTVVGYEGGSAEHPTYPQVNTGETGYAESVQVTFDCGRDERLQQIWGDSAEPYVPSK
ncbi:MAG: peptide-methionine (S)-S-oxide reductase [Gemmatimonadaceae bacterium]